MPATRSQVTVRATPDDLSAALERARARSTARRETAAAAATAAFRAAVEARLTALETELAEVKGRLNGLLFLVAGAVIAQIALRLLRL